jgi:hypothetical protein
MRVLFIGAVAIGLVMAACSEEELDPARPRQSSQDAGAVDDAAGDAEAGAFPGYPCNSILGCVQGCTTTQCQTDCAELASPKAQGIIRDWQACLDVALRSATCAPYCTSSDAGADAGDGGDAGSPTGPGTTNCSVCALLVCKVHLDACVADK